jgi:hypothetical protein
MQVIQLVKAAWTPMLQYVSRFCVSSTQSAKIVGPKSLKEMVHLSLRLPGKSDSNLILAGSVLVSGREQLLL